MTKRVRIRTLLIGGLFTLFFVGMMMRVYWVQVVDAAWLVDKARNVWEKGEVLKAQRGSIVDRNNQVLAEDGPAYTVVVDPLFISQNKKNNEVVRGLAAILGKSESDMMSLVAKEKDDGSLYQWVEVRNEGWKIDNDVADEIKQYFKPYRSYNGLIHLYEYGIYLEEKQKRYYPSNRMASHLLGYFDKGEKAVLGLEAQFNEVLKGTSGRIVTEQDPRGNELPNAKVSYEPAIDGKMLKLTIDKQIQSYIESAIDEAYTKWKPKSMTVIAADPKTMEILGIANKPNFNPNQYWDFDSQSDFFNHAVGSMYEPGSTFKLVTLAAAVEEGKFNPNETFSSGSIKVPGAIIHDHDRHGWGTISYLEALKRSSNVGFVKLGYEKLGEDKLKEYIAKFGFGEKTEVDIPGETKGVIDFKYPSEIATATFGQGGVSVTTLQQVAAFAAIANGGKLMWPHVVKEIIDPKSNQSVQTFSPRVVREVVSEQTAKRVSEYLEQVVADQKIGTGRFAHIDGYRIAGKTGTANKVINGKYSDDKWLVSFIGYAPVEDPKILIAVIADEPDLHGDYREAGKLTLPVFKTIMSQSLRYLKVASNEKETKVTEKENAGTVIVPDLTGLTSQAVKNEMERYNVPYERIGNGSEVVDQFPKPGTEIGSMQRIYVLTQAKEQIEQPQFAGKSLRDALELCSLLSYNCQTNGEGFVTSQTDAGSERTIVLNLQPANLLKTSVDSGRNQQVTTKKNSEPSKKSTTVQQKR